MKKSIDFHWIFVLTGSISLALIYLLVWSRMITTKSEYDGADFMGLYSAARISQQHGFPFMYDVEMQVEVQSQVVGFQFPVDQTSYFTHPPFVILLVNLIANENYTGSLVRWMVILLILNGSTVFILMKSISTSNFAKRDRWILAAGAFLFFPTFSGFMNGQDIIILLLGASIWMLHFIEKNQITAGLGLGLSTIRPQTAIMLAIPFLLKHRGVFLGFIIGGGVLALISLGEIGLTGLSRYFNILGVVENGMWHLPHSKDMPTISGIIRRTFETMDKNLFRYIIWSGYITGLTVISIWWRKNRKTTEKHLGILVLASLIFVPYAHYHELALLLIPIFCLIRILSLENLVSKKYLASLPLAVSLVLMVGFIGAGILKYILVHIIILLLGYFLFFPEKMNSLSAKIK